MLSHWPAFSYAPLLQGYDYTLRNQKSVEFISDYRPYRQDLGREQRRVPLDIEARATLSTRWRHR